MRLPSIFPVSTGMASNGFYLVTLSVLLLLNSGCSDGPREQYTNLCINIAKTIKQAQSCSCLAYEYGKVLTTEEYRTVNTMLERSIQDLKERNGDLSDFPPEINKEGIDEDVFKTAMQKITLLQRSRICGYAPE